MLKQFLTTPTFIIEPKVIGNKKRDKKNYILVV